MVIFLIYCFFCAVLRLFFFVLQVQFTIRNFSENGLKRWRNQEFGEKAEADRELHSRWSQASWSQRVLKMQRLASNINSDREQVKVSNLGFRGWSRSRSLTDRDQGRQKLGFSADYEFLNVNLNANIYMHSFHGQKTLDYHNSP